ncbi:phosphotransferase enzyme family protein [Leptolyngbya sp. FACHB-261]|uniref:phosphotransferase enzyme family protein n=1 Tax=Leptolyngbya sp. FACHB-261 TaxID=2692806 RepID=UPI001684E0EF|nr:phosphotransferase [Leptolyngbya sp. FACHB-261]MBD2101674.1 phosphotransferase [Leptolyngbya sp. FACHB-261]
MSKILEERLQQAMDDDPEEQRWSRWLYGTDHPPTIAQAVEQFCQSHLNSSVASCEFFVQSVSSSLGLTLDNGERVVIKVRSPGNISLDALQAIGYIQHQLALQGFPCPKVRVQPNLLLERFASIEELMDIGEHQDAHHPNVCKTVAEGLADLLQKLQPFANVPALPSTQIMKGQLWWKAHIPIFADFACIEGAKWIDEIATSAKAILDESSSSLILGHADWSAQNMLFSGNRISVVYDWDSLRLETEPFLVGAAAATFPCNHLIGVVMPPTLEETQHFVQEYEAVRSHPFSKSERLTVFAAASYLMAYIARCEHYSDPQGKNYNGSFRQILQQHSRAYTNLGLD